MPNKTMNSLVTELEQRVLDGTLRELPGLELIPIESSEALRAKAKVYCSGHCTEDSDCISRQTCIVVPLKPDGTLDTGNAYQVRTAEGCEQRGFFSRLLCRLGNLFAQTS